MVALLLNAVSRGQASVDVSLVGPCKDVGGTWTFQVMLLHHQEWRREDGFLNI